MSEERPEYAILNGELVPYGEARVSVMAPGMTFASLVFEGLRGYWNADERQLYVFRMAEHLERMQFGMALMEFDAPPGVDEFARQIGQVIQANELREDCYIRPQAYVDDWGDMKATGPIGSSVVCRRRPRAAAFEAGMHFMVSSWRRNSDEASPPRIKSAANYLNSRLVGLEAKRAGFDGAVILNPNGTVSEGPGGCLFLLRHGRLATPTVNAGILESITRATLLELAGEIGIEAEERDFTRTELYLADELFYCGTGQEMIPVLSVDGKPIGAAEPGPVTRRLQAAYDDVLRGRDDRFRHWLTAIYD